MPICWLHLYLHKEVQFIILHYIFTVKKSSKLMAVSEKEKKKYQSNLKWKQELLPRFGGLAERKNRRHCFLCNISENKKRTSTDSRKMCAYSSAENIIVSKLVHEFYIIHILPVLCQMYPHSCKILTNIFCEVRERKIFFFCGERRCLFGLHTG